MEPLKSLLRWRMTDPILIPVAAGELFDKLLILQIKSERIADAGKLVHVRLERTKLDAVAARLRNDCADPALLQQLEAELLEINRRLWDLENSVRAFDAAGDFGPAFIASARQIYAGNDQRAAIKLRINLLLGSAIIEAKEHGSPTRDAGAG